MTDDSFIRRVSKGLRAIVTETEAQLQDLSKKATDQWDNFRNDPDTQELMSTTRDFLNRAETRLTELSSSKPGQVIIKGALSGLAMTEEAIKKGRQGLEDLLSKDEEVREKGKRLVEEATSALAEVPLPEASHTKAGGMMYDDWMIEVSSLLRGPILKPHEWRELYDKNLSPEEAIIELQTRSGS